MIWFGKRSRYIRGGCLCGLEEDHRLASLSPGGPLPRFTLRCTRAGRASRPQLCTLAWLHIVCLQFSLAPFLCYQSAIRCAPSMSDLLYALTPFCFLCTLVQMSTHILLTLNNPMLLRLTGWAVSHFELVINLKGDAVKEACFFCTIHFSLRSVSCIFLPSFDLPILVALSLTRFSSFFLSLKILATRLTMIVDISWSNCAFIFIITQRSPWPYPLKKSSAC